MKDFEQACQEKYQTFWPPRSPKLNGGIELINQTWRTEFYNFREDFPENILQLSSFVKNYQHYYNSERPHKALDFYRLSSIFTMSLLSLMILIYGELAQNT